MDDGYDTPATEDERTRRIARMLAGAATDPDFLASIAVSTRAQRIVSARLTLASAAVCSVVEFVAPGSMAVAGIVAVIGVGVLGQVNFRTLVWMIAAAKIIVDPPSAQVRRAAVKLAAWGLAGDAGAMWFIIHMLRQAHVIPSPAF